MMVEKVFVASPQPWMPMTDITDLRVMGKFLEELGELGEAVADDAISDTDFAKEIADVLVNRMLVGERFEILLPRVEPAPERAAPFDVVSTLAIAVARTTAAAARCLIQGIDERESSTGRSNRAWLIEELMVLGKACGRAISEFELDEVAIKARMAKKRAHLLRWHMMVGDVA